MIHDFLTEEGILAVNDAVAQAEKKTAGEIKVLVVESSQSFKGRTKTKKAEARANREFFELGLNHTQGNTGILIMVSLTERRVVVRASETIDQFYDNGMWQTIVDTVTRGIKNNDSARGICNAVAMCGDILSKHFPVQPDDINEVPDEIVFKE